MNIRSLFCSAAGFCYLLVFAGCYFDPVTPFKETNFGRYQNINALTLEASGDTAEGVLSSPNYSAWFAFHGQADSIYSFTVSSSAYLDLAILPESRDTVLSAFTFSSLTGNRTWICPQTGTYYVLLNCTGSLSEYSYVLYFNAIGSSIIATDGYEPDNSYLAATTILTDGTSQIHTLPGVASEDLDYFEFSATAGSTYYIETTGSTDTYLELFSTNGTTLLLSNDDGGTGLNAYLSWTCATSGTYYFLITKYGSTSTGGTYSVSVTRSGGSVTVSADSYEPDNTYAAATTISTGGLSQSHTLHTASTADYDWFTFSATAGIAYDIETAGATDTYLELYSTNGTTLLDSDDDSGLNNNAWVTWTCLTSGTYYFRVRGYYNSTTYLYKTGAYTVSVLAN